MKPFNLKRIIGTAISLTALVLLGGGAELAAQVEIKYPSRAPANGTFTCVGDTVLVTATADDLTVPTGTHWSGDAYVQKEGGKITKRFFTYHPYQTADPTVLTSREFEFRVTANGTPQTHKVNISAKSCPPKPLNTSKVTVTSFGDKYNLGNINFDYAFENQTSNEQHIRVVPAINPAQPFCPLGKNGTHLSRSNLNQVNATYRAIQISDADYTFEAFYNEGDSLDRKTVFKVGSFNLTEELGTLQPDAAGYCPGNAIEFSLTLSPNWQNVLNQTIGNDESKIGACFDWNGSPSPVSFKRRDGSKYFFSTTVSGSSTADFRCKMSVLIKYANAKNNPRLDTSFTATFDVPVVQPQYREAKGFSQHEISVCQGDALAPSLTQLTDGATVSEYRDGDNKKIPTPGHYIATKSEEISAIITAPCPWTDKLKINVIEAGKIESFSVQHDTLICAGATLSFSATANSEITWNIMSDKPSETDSYTDAGNGVVHTRTFSANAMVGAIVNKCGKPDARQFNVQVVEWPEVSMSRDVVRDCPYTEVNLSGTGGSNPEYKLYDLRNNNKDITNDMRAYITSAGLTAYPLRPNDNLKLIYTASNQANGTTANTRPTSLSCSNSAEASIIANVQPTVRLRYNGTEYDDGQTVCVPRDAEFTLTARNADGYQWLDAPTLSQEEARNFELAADSPIRVRGVNNVTGCADTCTVNCVVSVDKADRVKADTVCPGEQFCFEADVLPNTTYAWTGADGLPTGNTTASFCDAISIRQERDVFYTYTLRTKRDICEEALTYTLKLNKAPNIDLQANTINGSICVGEELVFNYNTGLPANEHPQFNFTKDGGPVSGGHEGNGDTYLYRKANVQPSDAGRYILTVTTQDLHPCAAKDTTVVQVEEPAAVQIILAADTACEGDQNTLTANVTPAGHYRYQWSNANRIIIDSYDASIEVTWQRGDNGPLHLTVYQNACESGADAEVAVIPTPQLTMPKDTNLCQNLSICLNPTVDIEPEEYRWFRIKNNKMETLPTQEGLSYCLEDADESMSGGYFVLVTHIVGNARCYNSSDTTEVTVRPTPDIRIEGPDYVCDQSTVMLRAVSNMPGTVIWNNHSTEEVIEVAEPGRYEVTRISPYGCQNSAEHYLVSRALPYFSLPPDTSICRGTETMLYGPDDMDFYFWNDGTQEKDHIVDAAGLYVLTVERNGCSFSDSTRIYMTFCGQFHFPTAFTPNDNRVNDTWGAISSAKDEDMAEFDLMVFDRNGKKVFHGKRLSEQWDGKYKGQPCPPGVYTYTFKALEKIDGIKYRTNGTVTIVL